MNITPPAPAWLYAPTVNPNTEALRRDNQQREVIPASEQGAQGQGLGADSEKQRLPGSALVYERPQPMAERQATAEQSGNADNAAQDESGEQPGNDSDQASAGRDQADDKQQQARKAKKEAQDVAQLEARDKEVRIHEQAHAAVGGQYASAPRYEYTTGPDNKRYVTDGEVSIDVSKAATPAQTIEKMQLVQRAALAPAEPSAQDRKVAAEAAQQIATAKREEFAANSEQVTADSQQVTPTSEEVITQRDTHASEQTAHLRASQVIAATYQAASRPSDAGFSALA